MLAALGGKTTSYTKFLFRELIAQIENIRQQNNYRFRLVVGGPGAWQFETRKEQLDTLPYSSIDNVLIGEYDGIADRFLHQILSSSLPRIYRNKEFPPIDQIPAGMKLRGTVT